LPAGLFAAQAVELERNQEGEQSESFHQGGEDDAVDEELACHFGLASHTFQSSGSGDADTDTGHANADGAESSTYQGGRFDNCLRVNPACHLACLGNQLVVHWKSPLLLIFCTSLNGNIFDDNLSQPRHGLKAGAIASAKGHQIISGPIAAARQ
jgi:hypothetical protein